MTLGLLVLGAAAAVLLAPAVLQAQGVGADAPAEVAAGRETVFSLVMTGGPLMYPIFLCSLVILTVAIERLVSLRSARVGAVDLVAEALERLPSRRDATGDALEAARAWAAETGTLVGRVLGVGLGRLHRDEAHAEAGLEEAAAKELHLMQRRLRPFGVVATIAPLLGLLGTVFGLIICFGEATEAGATERAQTLSDGIYHALVTTAAGLTVAIPAMLLNHFFQGRVDKAVDTVDDAATRFLDVYYGDAPSGSSTSSSSSGTDAGAVTGESRGAPPAAELPAGAQR